VPPPCIIKDENQQALQGSPGSLKTRWGSLFESGDEPQDIALTVHWAAPELLHARYPDLQRHVEEGSWHECFQPNPQTDVYALAMVFWELVTCEYPFGTLNDYKVSRAITARERPKINSSIPQQLQQLIEVGWGHDPETRPDAAEFVRVAGQLKTSPLNSPI